MATSAWRPLAVATGVVLCWRGDGDDERHPPRNEAIYCRLGPTRTKRCTVGKELAMYCRFAYSYISTCQRPGLDPFVYLRDVFRRLPTQPPEQVAELLPDRW